MCIKFAPEVICCAAIWMAARVLQLVLPPKWWELFDAAKVRVRVRVRLWVRVRVRVRVRFRVG